MTQKKSNNSTALAVVDTNTMLAPYVFNLEDMALAIRDNFDDGLSINDLNRITVPGAGGLAFSVRTLEGDKALTELKGVILKKTAARRYWASQELSNTPPDCFSNDGKIGIGAPGGSCAACPFNQFGSGKGNSGKACHERRLLLFLMEGQSLPVLVDLPVMSMQPLQQYMVDLMAASVSMLNVETCISLVNKTNAKNIKYSIAQFKMGRKLSAEESSIVRGVAKQLGEVIDTQTRPEYNAVEADGRPTSAKDAYLNAVDDDIPLM